MYLSIDRREGGRRERPDRRPELVDDAALFHLAQKASLFIPRGERNSESGVQEQTDRVELWTILNTSQTYSLIQPRTEPSNVLRWYRLGFCDLYEERTCET